MILMKKKCKRNQPKSQKMFAFSQALCYSKSTQAPAWIYFYHNSPNNLISIPYIWRLFYDL